MIFNHYLRFPESTAKSFYQIDYLHPNARGHVGVENRTSSSQRILADLFIGYIEYELCMLTKYGLPIVPSHLDTIATSEPASRLIQIPFPLDSPKLVDPITAPVGWEKTFELEPIESIASERRHFVLPTTPYSLPMVSLFTPLRDVVDPFKPDPASPQHILGLVQPKLYCADANDHENPMNPTSREGWNPFVWNGEKHFWVSSTVGARIAVDITVQAGR